MLQPTLKLKTLVERTKHFTEQHTAYVVSCCSVMSSRGVVKRTKQFTEQALNINPIITHCARTNQTNVQGLVKRKQQHSTSWKTKEMLSRSGSVY